MREIFFRGQHTHTKEFKYGYLFYSKKDKIYKIGDGIIDYFVIEGTIGQYTGLRDKNGTRIFEGDILLVGGTQKVVVSFKDGQFVISHYAINLLRDRTLESEVIGNIHDNPELLEVDNVKN